MDMLMGVLLSPCALERLSQGKTKRNMYPASPDLRREQPDSANHLLSYPERRTLAFSRGLDTPRPAPAAGAADAGAVRENTIEQWFMTHPLPEDGAIVRDIPDFSQF